jgi:2-oxoglutarate dehydrogenase E2 component (EC 2.3.1.61)
MSVEIKVPGLPESVTEATIAAWHKKPGERVRRDENLVDLETDKVVLEVPAVADGVLQEVRAETGRTVTAGQVLAVLVADGGSPADQASTNGAAQQEPQSATAPARDDAEPAAAAPSVRKLVAEMGLEEATIPATGKGGRLTREDVLGFARVQDSRDSRSTAPASPPAKPGQSSAPPAPAPRGRHEERVPMTRIRARIAERLKEAQNTAAMLTTFNEVDLKEVSELRSRHKEAFEKQHGVKLGFMSFFVRAAVQALREHPTVNASIDGQDIVYHAYQDIGIAVSTERGWWCRCCAMPSYCRSPRSRRRSSISAAARAAAS